MGDSETARVNVHWCLSEILTALVRRYERTMTAKYDLAGPEFLPISGVEIEALRQTVLLLREEAGKLYGPELTNA